MKEAIPISGIGIICAIGNNPDEVLCSLRNRHSGIGRMTYLKSVHSDLPVGEVKMSNDEMKALLGIADKSPASRTSLMGAIAVRQALRQAGIDNPAGKRVVVISGTTVGNMDVTEQYFDRMKTDDSLLKLPHSNECGKSTDETVCMAGLEGAQVCTISTACSSALNSIILGAEMLKNDEADIVVAGGSECLSRFHLNGFNSLMILDQKQCRPFDAARAGLNLGEGAAFVVLQKEAERPLAYIEGYGNRCDAFHQTASSPEGEGAFLAMTDALKMARLSPQDIQYVNAHGTGTPDNDASESRALIRIFGENMPEISSTKAFTGHTTSASGSIETVISILAIQNGFTPANLGWSDMIEGGFVPTPGHTGVRLEHVLCNSFGFGGNDSSLVIGSERPSSGDSCRENFLVEEAARVTVTEKDDLSLLKSYVPPMELRRMGKLMRAAFLSSLQALSRAGIECPDAIVAATSRGMLENSQQFLEDLIKNDEQMLKPTLFMLSTHNTISSALAIRTGCHGYNITYSQGDDSKSWAVKDAERLIRTGKAGSVLVCSFDESTPVFQSFAERSHEDVPSDLFIESIVYRSVG